MSDLDARYQKFLGALLAQGEALLEALGERVEESAASTTEGKVMYALAGRVLVYDVASGECEVCPRDPAPPRPEAWD